MSLSKKTTPLSSKQKKTYYTPSQPLSSISHKHPRELHRINRSFKYIPPSILSTNKENQEKQKPTVFPEIVQEQKKEREQEQKQEREQEQEQESLLDSALTTEKSTVFLGSQPHHTLKYPEQQPIPGPSEKTKLSQNLLRPDPAKLNSIYITHHIYKEESTEDDNENQLNVLKIRKMRNEILSNTLNIGKSFVKLSNDDVMKCVDLINEAIQKKWKNVSQYAGKEQITVQYSVVSLENSMECINDLLCQLYRPHKVWVSKVIDNSSYFSTYSLVDIDYCIFSTPLVTMFFKYNQTPQLFYLYSVDKEELKDGDVIYLGSKNNVFIVKDKYLYHEKLQQDEYLTGVGGYGGIFGIPVRISFNEKEDTFQSKYEHLDNVFDTFFKFCDNIDYTKISDRTIENF
jgi:hypothetical protein